MQLKKNTDFHLTYCTNIHPGETWEEAFSQLREIAPLLKSDICPSEPFGIGLRLSAQAASQLLEGGRLDRFKRWLDEEQLYVFTMNGFPYGDFHGRRVKEQVYAPDWRKKERLDYTLNLVTILAYLLPEGMDGSISTSPLSYKYWLADSSEREEVFREGSRNLAKVAYRMEELREQKGLDLHLDIEPEPDCLLENSSETIDFFNQWLFSEGVSFLNDQYGMASSQAEELLRAHVGVCYDTCHFAVEYENPAQALERLCEAGIRIGKVQISSALKLQFENMTGRKEAVSRLRPFEESTYLHQVVERQSDGTFFQYRDLSDALAQGDSLQAEEWRIHYHVPIFIAAFDNLQSTQDDIIKSWEVLKDMGYCRHFEIETYTWEVLPDSLKQNLADSIRREFYWALELMDPSRES